MGRGMLDFGGHPPEVGVQSPTRPSQPRCGLGDETLRRKDP